MTLRITFLFILLGTFVAKTFQTEERCNVSLERQSIMLAITNRIPMSDGSSMQLEEGKVSETLINLFKNNMNAMGMQTVCSETECTIFPKKNTMCADVMVAAMMGNFLNGDLKEDDSLATITIDVETGLLRREKAKQALRSVFIDFLLILTIVMLVKRANDDNENKP